MEDYKKGILRLNSKGFGFVKIEDSDEEIFIPKQDMNFALNEDIVLVKIEDSNEIESNNSESHKQGKIIKIIEHARDTVVGTFQKSKNFAFVVPDDKNFGTDIFVPKKGFGNAKNNQKVIIKITKFSQKGKKAEGKVIEILGNKDAAGIDMLSLIKQYDLPYEFPKPVKKEAKNIDMNISKNEMKKRTDYREQEIYTIDGEDAKDLDDAISVEKNEDGNFILYVHIADVSHYVKENSFLDKEAIIRGTSIYMMDRVIPMLPQELSNGICSLNAGEDRFALSVIMEINNKGQVISSDIKKTIINVTKRMSYNQVYDILNNESNSQSNNEKNNEKYKMFFLMKELAKILKDKRVKDGSLDLNVPESKIILDKNGVAIDVCKYEITFANEIIEQFMLITNETVAEKFYWLEAPFIFRVHPIPDNDKINELNKFLWNLGYKIKGNKDNIHPKAFAEVLEQVKGKPEERVVSNLILRTLKIARYESENQGHFGIASKYYCHFTSPIRRYPDLYIHRIISKYISSNYNLPEDTLNKYFDEATEYARTSSEREKVAQKVERDSVDIKKAEYMQSKIGEEYDGIISSITSFGVFVELENTVEGLIRFEHLGNEYFAYDEEHKTLRGEVSNENFRIGDKIKIRVIDANKELRRIDFERILN